MAAGLFISPVYASVSGRFAVLKNRAMPLPTQEVLELLKVHEQIADGYCWAAYLDIDAIRGEDRPFAR